MDLNTENMSVAQIKELCASAGKATFKDIDDALESDPRSGVQAARKSMQKRVARELAEEVRLAGMYQFEDEIREKSSKSEHCLIVGLDEVGRGPLAGPCAIGAVVLDSRVGGYVVSGLNDSKKLSAKQRASAAKDVKEHALAQTVQYSSAKDIDEKGIAACLRDCFSRGIAECERQLREQGVEEKIEIVLLDGNPLHLDPREVNVIKGDGKSASIAAASIIAKEDRDALMVEFDGKYPEYGFAGHKGYGSQDHIEAIKRCGLSPIHRTSFCKSFV